MPATTLTSSGVTFPDNTKQGSGVSLGNRIINGDMRISQRNGPSTTVTVSATPLAGKPAGSGFFHVDRWAVLSNTAGSKLAVSHDSNSSLFNYGPTGFNYGLLVRGPTSPYPPGVGEQFAIHQGIEGFNIADLNWGRSSGGKPITVSFWLFATLAGDYAVSIRNGSLTRSYVTTLTIPGSIWCYCIVTIPPDTLVSTTNWPTNYLTSMFLTFDIGSGANYAAANRNTWQGGNYTKLSGAADILSNVGTAGTGSSVRITGVQLEVGSVATPFETRSFGQELALCRRYYYKTYNYRDAVGYTATSTHRMRSYDFLNYGAYNCYGCATVQFPVVMRVAPTCTIWPSTVPVSGPGSTGGQVYEIDFISGGGSKYRPANMSTILDNAAVVESSLLWYNTTHVFNLEADAETYPGL